jgi:hypothetical protein
MALLVILRIFGFLFLILLRHHVPSIPRFLTGTI